MCIDGSAGSFLNVSCSLLLSRSIFPFPLFHFLSLALLPVDHSCKWQKRPTIVLPQPVFYPKLLPISGDGFESGRQTWTVGLTKSKMGSIQLWVLFEVCPSHTRLFVRRLAAGVRLRELE